MGTAQGEAGVTLKGEHMTDYHDFLAQKRSITAPVGFDVNEADLNPMLFPFQRAIVRWSLHRGRAALFEDCGLGKTPQQLEWGHQVHKRTGGNVLILCPLAVAAQTVREGEKFGIQVTLCRSQADVRPGINVANYERLHLFDRDGLAGIVLDESSILKSFEGVTRKAITAFAADIPYRLCCTATPAPNDLVELTNHAEFLNIMSGKEIIALFFTQDGNTTHAWRLKGHAELHISHIIAQAPKPIYTLFPIEAITMAERRQARRESIDERVNITASMVNNSTEQWVVWCDLNKEADALKRAIPDPVEVRGADTPEHKERAAIDFAAGAKRVIISKPSIYGFGLNWQFCHNVAFVGLSDSYEQFYQTVRRCWRFGQTEQVTARVVAAETEGAVVANIKRKEAQATAMFENITRHMAGLSLGKAERDEMAYEHDTATGAEWTLHLGDSVQRMDEIETESVGLAVFSPPFPGMYAYTNSSHDMGNITSIDNMIEHFRYLVAPEKLGRVMMPGRTVAIHLCQLTAMKSREGYIGLHDYRGKVIALMQEEGWIYAGEATIEKNPQIQAVRNKERGLLFKSLAEDSSVMRMALADYLIYFRKPGENPVPIHAGLSTKYNPSGGWITEEEWIEWASPIWFRHRAGIPGGIRETDVLNVRQARETDDERHLAPLQLGVIERAVKLWSAPGDLVLDPFNGIGSTGYVALQHRRRYVGIELKRSYYESSKQNLMAAVNQQRMVLV